MSSAPVLKIYRTLLRTAVQFPDYNVRLYTLRHVKLLFHETLALNLAPGSVEALKEVGKAEEGLELVKRQVVIAKMFPGEGNVMESFGALKK